MLRHAKNEYLFGRYINFKELEEKLRDVTLDEVVECCRQAFRSDEVSLATLGPIRRKDLDLSCMLFD